jgi:hypothetical protein
MKALKEVLRALLNNGVVLFSITSLQLLSSCAHHFDHKTINSYEGTIEQVLKVKIRNKDDKQKLTVYASINREKKQAVLDGIGKLDKHVFTLEVKNGSYTFKDYINNKEEKGNIRDFDLVPLDEETLFVKIDKDALQPIIIDDPSKDLHVEITVLEQRGIK